MISKQFKQFINSNIQKQNLKSQQHTAHSDNTMSAKAWNYVIHGSAQSYHILKRRNITKLFINYFLHCTSVTEQCQLDLFTSKINKLVMEMKNDGNENGEKTILYSIPYFFHLTFLHSMMNNHIFQQTNESPRNIFYANVMQASTGIKI